MFVKKVVVRGSHLWQSLVLLCTSLRRKSGPQKGFDIAFPDLLFVDSIAGYSSISHSYSLKSDADAIDYRDGYGKCNLPFSFQAKS